MPLKLVFTEDHGVIFRGSGVVEGAETTALNAELIETILNGRPVLYQLVDLTQVDDFRSSPDEMKRLAVQDAEILKRCPNMVIAIAVNDSAAFGMNRMYGSYLDVYSQASHTGMFKECEPALRWIQKKLKELGPT